MLTYPGMGPSPGVVTPQAPPYGAGGPPGAYQQQQPQAFGAPPTQPPFNMGGPGAHMPPF